MSHTILQFHRWLIIGLTCFSTMLSGAVQELLQPEDVHKIMQQIFDQHVDKKEITASILKNSFKVYIDQFDPDRLYLLEEEISPYIQMSESEVAQVVDRYQKNQFPEYLRLNNLIQKSIDRAQKIRKQFLDKSAYSFFKKSDSIQSDGYEGWRDPDLKQNFATTTSELDKRWKNAFVQFIAIERKMYGDEYVSDRASQTFHIFDKNARDHENQYLFLTDSGQPMSEAQKQNALTMHILKALANSLDAHTTVLSTTEAADMRVRLEKEQPGIGIQFRQDNEGAFVIQQLVKNSPAAKSGVIRIDDTIVKVNDQLVKGKSVDDLLELLHGSDGSKVTLTLQRKPDNSEIIVPITREQIEDNTDRAQSSYDKISNGIIGKIKLDTFYQNDKGITSENDVKTAIDDLKKQGNLRGLILDLRENSGGFLSQAIKIVGLFITNGVVVVSKYFNGEEHFYRDMDGKRIYDGPLIVLTSKATASAAEIVAQALQDYGVALIIGDEHTYGKGTIQSQTVTDNQGSAFFKVTVGKYYTVSGKTPQIQGVEADIVVPSQFAHEKLGEEYLDNSLGSDTISESYNDKLEDIAPNLKSWYMTYYTPFLQHKTMLWDNMLPELKKTSADRIARNKQYQAYLKGTNLSSFYNNGNEDLQMAEAVNIMKDIIRLEPDKR